MYICTQTYARTYIHYIFIHIVSSASPLARSRRGTPSDPPRQELFGSSEVSQNTAQIKTTNIVIIYQLKKKTRFGKPGTRAHVESGVSLQCQVRIYKPYVY